MPSNEGDWECSLFWPTVGPILSAGIPGIGLYSVLIFSSMVWREVITGGTISLAEVPHRNL